MISDYFENEFLTEEVLSRELSGDKIERLLFQAGFDSEYTIGPEDLPAVEIKADELTILLSEPFAGNGTWFISPGTVSIEKIVDGRYTSSIFPTVSSEEELVEAIEDFAETA